MSNLHLHKKVPYSVIICAVDGDAQALHFVVHHYSNYISSLSLQYFYDSNGNKFLTVNEDIKKRIETKLIAQILQFDLNY